MNQNIQNRKLNAGLITAAVLFFSMALYLFYDVISTGISLVRYFDDLDLLTFTELVILPIFEPICYIGFGIYILVFYKKGKDLIGILSVAVLTLRVLIALCLTLAFADIDFLIHLPENQFSNDFIFIIISFLCLLVFTIALLLKNKIMLIISSALILALPLYNMIQNLWLSIIYNFPLSNYNLTTPFIRLIIFAPFLVFVISAFLKTHKAPAYVPTQTTYIQNQYVPPIYNPQPQYTVQPEPQTPEIDNIALQLEQLNKRLEAGEISENTYNTIKQQLLNKI